MEQASGNLTSSQSHRRDLAGQGPQQVPKVGFGGFFLKGRAREGVEEPLSKAYRE